jgi:membrane-bound lytic murein transglycosylase A
MAIRAKLAAGFALIALLGGCTAKSDPVGVAEGPRIVFTHDPPSEFDLLPGWRTELKSTVVAAFAAGCPLIRDPRTTAACRAVNAVPAGNEDAARLFLIHYFRPQLLGTDYLTGYFELTVKGSLKRDRNFTVPVLAPPRYPNQYPRPDIMGGALDGQGLEILYLQSEADLYFLQLQGSGRVILPDGSMVRLGTAADNGQPRIPVEHLFGEAQIPNHDLSIPGIRAWAADHVPETNGRLARDQAYVFFRPLTDLPPQYGPYGAFTLPLLPMRSVAVDPSYTKLGTMLWIATNVAFDTVRMPHLVIAQDTGSLITGPARLDLFFGWGPDAERIGGHEHARAQVWALVPR